MSVAPALAQQTLERVEITGSNIRRVQSETASPVQVITRDDIERSGKATVGEYLQTLSADSQGSIPNSFGNGFATGSQGVSLLSLAVYLIVIAQRLLAGFGGIEVVWDRDILQFFLTGVVLFGLGLIGEYVGRIYQQVRERPRYLIQAILEPGER